MSRCIGHVDVREEGGGGDYSKDRYKGGIKDIKEWMIGYRCIGHVGVKDRGGGGDYSKDIYKGGSKDIKGKDDWRYVYRTCRSGGRKDIRKDIREGLKTLKGSRVER